MIPEKVLIGGHEYSVSIRDRLSKPNWCGENTYVSNEIDLRSDLSETKREEILCHEIIHGLLDNSGAFTLIVNNNNDNAVENFVCCIQNTFYRFMKDNTNLFKEKEQK